MKAELNDVVNVLRTPLLPIVDSITDDAEYTANWDHESQRWKQINKK